MKDPYGYRPYRGSRVRRRGILIDLLLVIAIVAAALWVLLLLLPLDEDGIRFPGQEDSTAAGSAEEENNGQDASNGEPSDGSNDSVSNHGTAAAPNGASTGAESGASSTVIPPGAENGISPETGPVEGAGTSNASGETLPEDGGSSAAEPDSSGAVEPVYSNATPAFLRKNAAKVEPRWGARPEQPKNNRMVLLSAEDFVRQADRLIALRQNGVISGAAVTVKDARGILYYPSAIPEVQGNRLILQPVEGFSETVARVRESGVQLTAVLYTHCDDRYPRRDESIALQNINGVGWRDGSLCIYLDPANPEATAYLTAVAAELDGLGFQELLLRGVGYPTSGWLARIAYPEDRFGVVTGFVTAMREAAPTARVSVWLDNPATADDLNSGQSVSGLSAVASRLFAVCPSDAEGGAAAVQAQVSAAAGSSETLVICTSSADAAASLPAVLMDMPLDSLG